MLPHTLDEFFDESLTRRLIREGRKDSEILDALEETLDQDQTRRLRRLWLAERLERTRHSPVSFEERQRLRAPGLHALNRRSLSDDSESFEYAVRHAGPRGLTMRELRDVLPFGQERFVETRREVKRRGRVEEHMEKRPNQAGRLQQQVVFRATGVVWVKAVVEDRSEPARTLRVALLEERDPPGRR